LSLLVYPALSREFSTAEISEHLYWYLGRSSGFVAYWLLFASVALGLGVSSRVADGLLARPWVFELHKFLSIFVLLGMVFHALIMLPDPWAGFTLEELLIPFKSHYRGTEVGIGQLVMYGSIIVSLSFYIKGWIGHKGWRLLHYTTFALFLGAMAHGIWAGTDSGARLAQLSYLASAVVILFLTFFRILATRSAGGKPRGRESPRPQRLESQPGSGIVQTALTSEALDSV
jgi:predicted ferric reductase